MLMQAKNAVGFDTPGAASSAADLEAQDPPKLGPKLEKIDIRKQDVFGMNFGRVWTLFRKRFWSVFWIGNARKKKKTA